MERQLLELVRDDLGENTQIPINHESCETSQRISFTLSDINDMRINKERNKIISVSYQHQLQIDSLEWHKNRNKS